MRAWDFCRQMLLLLVLLAHFNSCNGSSLEYSYDLNQPINFVFADSLLDALDVEGRRLFERAARHAAEALGVQAGWGLDKAHPDSSLPTENMLVQLTLGSVDCTGDRAGYVRWRPNNVLQICPSMLRERNYLLALSLVMHEMGHVVGGSHVACDGESVMAPDLNCPTRRYARAAADPDGRFWYSDTDAAELCRHTSGGLCQR